MCYSQDKCSRRWAREGVDWSAHLARLLRCDIAHKGLAALDGSDWVQIDTND